MMGARADGSDAPLPISARLTRHLPPVPLWFST